MQNIHTDYIIPTKENPSFHASCDYFGIIDGPYKAAFVGKCTTSTFALKYTQAINDLHDWIVKNAHVIDYYPKSRFTIFMMPGTVNKNGDSVQKVVYSLSAANAKLLLF